MDLATLANQLTLLQKELQAEIQQRKELETTVKDLQRALVDEQKKRKQITDWIKDNIGPNLEYVTERVSANIKDKGEHSGSEKGRRRRDKDKERDRPTSISTTTVSSKRDSHETTVATKVSATRGPIIDKVNQPINLVLERVEDHIFASKEYYDAVPRMNSTLASLIFSETDAFNKTNRPGRLNHFLNKRNHAQIKYNCVALPDKAVHFANHHGGKLVFVPDPTDEDFAQDNFNMGIMPTDECYPICTDGLVRSQIMYLVLRGICGTLNIP